MLGELVYEGKGKITGQRVLDSEAQIIEITILGRGKFKDIEVTELWTYITEPKPNNLVFCTGKCILSTNDGSIVATASGHGIGPFKNSGKMRYPGSVYFNADINSQLAFLNNLVGVNEYELEESENYVHKIWEWKYE